MCAGAMDRGISSPDLAAGVARSTASPGVMRRWPVIPVTAVPRTLCDLATVPIAFDELVETIAVAV